MCFICGKKQDERQQMGTGAFDRVVSDMQLKHSIQSVGPLGELAGSTRSLPVARAVGRPTRSVTWRFWDFGSSAGKVPAATAQTDKASFH